MHGTTNEQLLPLVAVVGSHRLGVITIISSLDVKTYIPRALPMLAVFEGQPHPKVLRTLQLQLY